MRFKQKDWLVVSAVCAVQIWLALNWFSLMVDDYIMDRLHPGIELREPGRHFYLLAATANLIGIVLFALVSRSRYVQTQLHRTAVRWIMASCVISALVFLPGCNSGIVADYWSSGYPNMRLHEETNARIVAGAFAFALVGIGIAASHLGWQWKARFVRRGARSIRP